MRLLVVFPGGAECIVRSLACHEGESSDTSHYYAITRSSLEVACQWRRYDDRYQWEIPLPDVVTEDAYLVFLENVESDLSTEPGTKEGDLAVDGRDIVIDEDDGDVEAIVSSSD